MTDWNEIVMAWTKWVNGEGPGVQARRDGHKEWEDWISMAVLDLNMYPQWRVKKFPAFARMFISNGLVQVAFKADEEDDVELSHPTQKWLGDWQRFRGEN
jgi:peroxiredoxin